jgi:molybdopterin converting factor subunit 1
MPAPFLFVFWRVMRVRVLFFGVLKDLLGRESETVELPEGSEAAEVVRHFGEKAQESKAIWGALAIAVNREYAERERVLTDGDEVALLPPVSGGGVAE